MMSILGFVLDIVLIGLLGFAVSYAMKLTKQLNEMRAGRAEMERFVLAFNATVSRAEAGVQGLKNAARSSGDDLEQLIEKGQTLRDELMFLTESADQIATRLTDSAGAAAQKAGGTQSAKIAPQKAVRAKPAPTAKKKSVADVSPIATQKKSASTPASAAEKELLRVLKKMG